MDYEQMGVQDLRVECQARGLGTARSRAELIQRLTDNDNTEQPSLADGEYVLSPDTVRKATVDADTIAGAAITRQTTRVFRQTFDAEPGGPDEETHLAYRQATTHAALEAGYRTRGDARLAATRDGQWVYEVAVRPGDPS